MIQKDLQIKDSKKRNIVEAAIKVFAKNGYEKTTMEEVAEKAKIAKGTVFYYFKSKEQLFFIIIREGFSLLATQLESGVEKIHRSEEKIEKLIAIQFEFFIYYSNFCRILLSELWRIESYWKKDLENLQKDYSSIVINIIEESKKDGLIKKEIDTKALSISLFGLVAVSSLEWAIFHKEIPKHKMYNTLKTILFQGIMSSK